MMIQTAIFQRRTYAVMKPKLGDLESVKVVVIKCGSVKVILDFLFSADKAPTNTATSFKTG